MQGTVPTTSEKKISLVLVSDLALGFWEIRNESAFRGGLRYLPGHGENDWWGGGGSHFLF